MPTEPYVPGMSPPAPMTADELLREPAGLPHGRVAMELGRRVANHVDAHGLGLVYAAETGFTLARQPDTVRAPDIAFVQRDRLPNPEPSGFPDLAPDLVGEDVVTGFACPLNAIL